MIILHFDLGWSNTTDKFTKMLSIEHFLGSWKDNILGLQTLAWNIWRMRYRGKTAAIF